MIAWPFSLLMCCLVTDGGGALILTSAERAKDFKTEARLRHRCTGEAVRSTPWFQPDERLHLLPGLPAFSAVKHVWASSGMKPFR